MGFVQVQNSATPRSRVNEKRPKAAEARVESELGAVGLPGTHVCVTLGTRLPFPRGSHEEQQLSRLFPAGSDRDGPEPECAPWGLAGCSRAALGPEVGVAPPATIADPATTAREGEGRGAAVPLAPLIAGPWPLLFAHCLFTESVAGSLGNEVLG